MSSDQDGRERSGPTLDPTPISLEVLLAEGRMLARSVVYLVADRPTPNARSIASFRGVDDRDDELPWLRLDLRAPPDPEHRREAVLSA
jgi:hypothetical protein